MNKIQILSGNQALEGREQKKEHRVFIWCPKGKCLLFHRSANTSGQCQTRCPKQYTTPSTEPQLPTSLWEDGPCLLWLPSSVSLWVCGKGQVLWWHIDIAGPPLRKSREPSQCTAEDPWQNVQSLRKCKSNHGQEMTAKLSGAPKHSTYGNCYDWYKRTKALTAHVIWKIQFLWNLQNNYSQFSWMTITCRILTATTESEYSNRP